MDYLRSRVKWISQSSSNRARILDFRPPPTDPVGLTLPKRTHAHDAYRGPTMPQTTVDAKSTRAKSPKIGHTQLLIDNQWVDAADGKTFERHVWQHLWRGFRV